MFENLSGERGSEGGCSDAEVRPELGSGESHIAPFATNLSEKDRSLGGVEWGRSIWDTSQEDFGHNLERDEESLHRLIVNRNTRAP